MLVEPGDIITNFQGYEVEVLGTEVYEGALVVWGTFVGTTHRFAGAIVEATPDAELGKDWAKFPLTLPDGSVWANVTGYGQGTPEEARESSKAALDAYRADKAAQRQEVRP